MPAGAIIPAVIGAASVGAQVYGTKKQADAAQQAAGQQVESANTARADLDPIYQSNVARMQPYANLGGAALGQLGALGGYNVPNMAVGTGGMAPGGMTGWYPSLPGGPVAPPGADRASQRLEGSMPTGETAIPRRSLASVGGGGQSSFTTQGDPSRRGPTMVRVMAPDGEVGEFPEQQATFLIAQGAKRVG